MKNKILDYCDEDTYDVRQAVKRRDTLRKTGKRYPNLNFKIDWNKIEEKACLAVCVGAVGLVIVHTVLFLIK